MAILVTSATSQKLTKKQNERGTLYAKKLPPAVKQRIYKDKETSYLVKRLSALNVVVFVFGKTINLRINNVYKANASLSNFFPCPTNASDVLEIKDQFVRVSPTATLVCANDFLDGGPAMFGAQNQTNTSVIYDSFSWGVLEPEPYAINRVITGDVITPLHTSPVDSQGVTLANQWGDRLLAYRTQNYENSVPMAIYVVDDGYIDTGALVSGTSEVGLMVGREKLVLMILESVGYPIPPRIYVDPLLQTALDAAGLSSIYVYLGTDAFEIAPNGDLLVTYISTLSQFTSGDPFPYDSYNIDVAFVVVFSKDDGYLKVKQVIHFTTWVSSYQYNYNRVISNRSFDDDTVCSLTHRGNLISVETQDFAAGTTRLVKLVKYDASSDTYYLADAPTAYVNAFVDDPYVVRSEIFFHARGGIAHGIVTSFAEGPYEKTYQLCEFDDPAGVVLDENSLGNRYWRDGDTFISELDLRSDASGRWLFAEYVTHLDV